MADPTAKTFRQIVQQQAAAIQARASGLVDFSVGSVTRAIIQAVAGVVLWFQAMILALLATTRAATSAGGDLESFVADFGGPFSEDGVATISRLGAAPAVGLVTFTRLTPQGASVIPVGATVETRDGRQKFAVRRDTGHGSWSDQADGYVMNDGVAEITVPVSTTEVGAAGNVNAGAVTVITSPIPGVDLVENLADFVNGRNSETDEAFRARFRSYVASLREATPPALIHYVESLSPATSAVLVEGQELDGTPRRGFAYIVVDDGTGEPSAELMEGVALIVDEHRAAGIEVGVYPPTIIDADVSFSVVGVEGDGALAVEAVTDFLNCSRMGADLSWSRVFQVAYDASPTITDITGLKINGGVVNIPVAPNEVVKAGLVENV